MKTSDALAEQAPAGAASKRRLMPGCDDGLLRAQPIFRKLSEDEHAFLRSARVGQIWLGPGQSVVAEGEAIELFTLMSGWAFRYKTLSDGRRQILNFLLPGDLIGMLEDGLTASPYGVETLSDSRLCQLPRSTLWDLFNRFPALAYDITWLCAREEAMVDDNLLSVGRRTAAERLAMLLIHLYKRALSVGLGKDERVPFPLNQQHLADAAGLSLVHTNKTLRQLHKQGLFDIKDGWLSVIKPVALQRLAEYYDQPLRVRPMI